MWLAKQIVRAWKAILNWLTVTDVGSGAQQNDEGFIRVLDPSDRWLNPTAFSRESREENFRGNPKWDISVAMESRCEAIRVLACLHGARRDVALDRPAYFRFRRSEVEGVGGTLADTDASPPWPEDYNDAHHDIASAQDEVARQMAGLYETDPRRVCEEDEIAVLRAIAGLLSRNDVDDKFKRSATYRFRRMFTDGGAERDRWKEVAKHHHILLEPNSVRSELRRMYQNRATRSQWTALLDELGVHEDDRGHFK